MCICILSTCVSVHHITAGACESQKRASDTLDLEIQLTVKHHVDAGN